MLVSSSEASGSTRDRILRALGSESGMLWKFLTSQVVYFSVATTQEMHKELGSFL